jgi:inner membrane protein
MDNITHSFVGALLGQMGLKRKTGLAMPTLIIAANIPDIDVVAVLLGGNQHLALRRGITHGPIAIILLPLLLWGAMLWFDRWQERRGKRPETRLPLHKGWLLALAYIACLTHPALDWLNNYGVRLLEPFSHQWFYGDSIFIVDVWILAALAFGVWLSLRRERAGAANWTRPAWISFMVICAYIFANGIITQRAESLVLQKLVAQRDPTASFADPLVVANAVPVQFWKRNMQWRDEQYFGYGWFTWPDDVFVGGKVRLHGLDARVVNAVSANPDGAPLLFWSRMPVAEIQGEGDTRQLVITDQRFGNSPARERFMIAIPWKEANK